MIHSGMMIDEGLWRKLEYAEKKHLKIQLAKLAILGIRVPGCYFRKINDDITIIFSDTRLARQGRNVDWGILYPTDYFYSLMYADIQSDNMQVPTIFAIKPDIWIEEFFEIFFHTSTPLVAVYQNKYFFQAAPQSNGLLLMHDFMRSQDKWK